MNKLNDGDIFTFRPTYLAKLPIQRPSSALAPAICQHSPLRQILQHTALS